MNILKFRYKGNVFQSFRYELFGQKKTKRETLLIELNFTFISLGVNNVINFGQ